MRSRLRGLVLASVLGLVPLAPSEHVHEFEEHGHERALVHRHLDDHLVGHEAGHDGAFDDDDGPVLTLDAFYTVPGGARPLDAPPAVVRAVEEPPAVVLFARYVEYLERLIHGPPRAPTGLRGPPIPSSI